MGDNWHLPEPATIPPEVTNKAEAVIGKRAKKSARAIVEVPNETPVEIPFSDPPPEEPDDE